VDKAPIYASDRLAKVRYPIHYFNNKFQALYTLIQDIAIDESLMELLWEAFIYSVQPNQMSPFRHKILQIMWV